MATPTSQSTTNTMVQAGFNKNELILLQQGCIQLMEANMQQTNSIASKGMEDSDAKKIQEYLQKRSTSLANLQHRLALLQQELDRKINAGATTLS